jgi:hypothetical protein
MKSIFNHFKLKNLPYPNALKIARENRNGQGKATDA